MIQRMLFLLFSIARNMKINNNQIKQTKKTQTRQFSQKK